MICLHPIRHCVHAIELIAKSGQIPSIALSSKLRTNQTLQRRAFSRRNLVQKIPTNQRRGNSTPPYVIFSFVVPAAGLTMACVYYYNSCLDYVPYTRRKRFIATTPEWEAHIGHAQYQTYLKQYSNGILPKDHRASVTVARVGSRIAQAAKDFTQEYNVVNSINSSPFTYTVIQSDDANAFVLPGNHVFVLTGLFKYVHNEDELASILGHETAHNLARHAGERASRNLFVKMLSYLAFIIDPSGLLFSFFVPAEALLFSLPHSREHELEADEIGLLLSSQACYDPKAAKKVFARMKHDADGGDMRTQTHPEFVSTHPGYDTRLSKFDEWMPVAMDRFSADDGRKCFAVRQEMKRARSLAAKMHDSKEM